MRSDRQPRGLIGLQNREKKKTSENGSAPASSRYVEVCLFGFCVFLRAGVRDCVWQCVAVFFVAPFGSALACIVLHRHSSKGFLIPGSGVTRERPHFGFELHEQSVVNVPACCMQRSETGGRDKDKPTPPASPDLATLTI